MFGLTVMRALLAKPTLGALARVESAWGPRPSCVVRVLHCVVCVHTHRELVDWSL